MLQSVDVSWPQCNYHPGAECAVIVAATSGDGGRLFTQSTYREDVDNARAAGKDVGFYHFNGNVDPVASAEYFWAVIKGDIRPGDIVVLDVESSQGGRFPAVSPAWGMAFSTRLAQLRGITVAQSRLGIYGNRSDMHAPGWGALERAGSWLYLASPGGYPENTPVGEWSHWTILQYSSAGGIDRDESESTFAQIAGTTQEVDMLADERNALLNIYNAIFFGGPSMKDAGKSISQSLAEIQTGNPAEQVKELVATVGALQAAVAALAPGASVDPAAITAAAEAGATAALVKLRIVSDTSA